VSADALPAGDLYLDLDLDVVDPRDVHDLRYPAPDGPPLAAVINAVRRVMSTGRVPAKPIIMTSSAGSWTRSTPCRGLRQLTA